MMRQQGQLWDILASNEWIPSSRRMTEGTECRQWRCSLFANHTVCGLDFDSYFLYIWMKKKICRLQWMQYNWDFITGAYNSSRNKRFVVPKFLLSCEQINSPTQEVCACGFGCPEIYFLPSRNPIHASNPRRELVSQCGRGRGDWTPPENPLSSPLGTVDDLWR